MNPSPTRVAAAYLKRGAMFQAPPRFVEVVEAWALQRFASYTLWYTGKAIEHLEVMQEALVRTERVQAQLPSLLRQLNRGKISEIRWPSWVTHHNGKYQIVQEIVITWDPARKQYRREYQMVGQSPSDSGFYLSASNVKETCKGHVEEYRTVAAKIPDLRRIEQRCKALGGKPEKEPRGFNTVYDTEAFPVDTRGWRYVPILAKRFGMTDAEVREAARAQIPSVPVYYGFWLSGWAGLWMLDGRLYVNQPSLRSYLISDTMWVEFQLAEASLRGVVEHESVHLAQTLMNKLLDLQDKAGIPHPEGRFTEYGPLGYPQSQKPGEYTEEGRQPHHLRDVEHQTRLHDEVLHFQLVAPLVPEGKRKALLHWWMGETDRLDPDVAKAVWEGRRLKLEPDQREFFTDMRKLRPARWHKAVGEFYRQVSALL